MTTAQMRRLELIMVLSTRKTSKANLVKNFLWFVAESGSQTDETLQTRYVNNRDKSSLLGRLNSEFVPL